MQEPPQGSLFSAHAAIAAFSAVRHFLFAVLNENVAIVAQLCAQVKRHRRTFSDQEISEIVHHIGCLGVVKQTVRMAADLIHGPLRLELLRRMEIDSSGVSNMAEWPPSGLCLIAHAYAHTLRSARPLEDKPLFDAIANRLDDVALLQLSVGELANLANAFSRLRQAADLGFVPLFDRLGRQLARSGSRTTNDTSAKRTPSAATSIELSLRDACVVLNAFAHASVRHEPVFFAFEKDLPALLNTPECDMRQLAMIAHAHVRVGLMKSSILPIIWARAGALALKSDAHGVALVLFAATKASALGSDGGSDFLHAISRRLLQLLKKDAASIEPATVAMVSYALVRGGCASAVDAALWHHLALRAGQCVPLLGFAEAANVAASFANLSEVSPGAFRRTAAATDALFHRLRERADAALANGGSEISPLAAAKLVTAFGTLGRYEAGQTAVGLARCCLLPRSSDAGLGVGPLRVLLRHLFGFASMMKISCKR